MKIKKSKISNLVGCLLMVAAVFLATPTLATVIFDDQFNDQVLPSGWTISPGRGSYSLTDNPGYLRYIIDANHTNYDGTGVYAKSLWLVRPFPGDQWMLKTAVTYNMRPGQPTNNRELEFTIAKPGDDHLQDFHINIERAVGVNDGNPGSNSMFLTIGNNSQTIYFPNSGNPLPTERWYFEIERNKDNWTIRASNDGDDSTFEYVYEGTSPANWGDDQLLELWGYGWYGSNNPPGYADFDFVNVLASGYVPPDSRPYVTFIDENGCPIQYDQGGGFQFINLNAATLPKIVYFKGIVHIPSGYCFTQPDGVNWCFTCYDLQLNINYNTDGTDVKTWSNVTDVQEIYFGVDTSKMNSNLADGSDLSNINVQFYECTNPGKYAQGPQGLNINKNNQTGCNPVTAIELSSFTAEGTFSKATIQWKTETEVDNAGFNLYRAESENGEYIKIPTALIAAKGTSTQGANYEFIDNNVKNRTTYYYKLEDIDLNGYATLHGPVSATPRLIYGIGK